MSYLSTSDRRRRPLAAGGRAPGLGDAAVAVDPVAILAAQVNRFGASAPAAYRFATTPFLDSGNLSPALALTALTIYQRRAADAYTQIPDTGSQALLEAANQAFSAPVPFVMGHIADVAQVIRAFGDMLGLPPAPGDPAPGMDTTTLALAAAAVLAIWWMAR